MGSMRRSRVSTPLQEPHPEKKVRQVAGVTEEDFLHIFTGGARVIERIEEGVSHLAEAVPDRRRPQNGQHEVYTFFHAPGAESLAEILFVIRRAHTRRRVEQSPHAQGGVDQEPAQGHAGALSLPLEDVVRQYEGGVQVAHEVAERIADGFREYGPVYLCEREENDGVQRLVEIEDRPVEVLERVDGVGRLLLFVDVVVRTPGDMSRRAQKSEAQGQGEQCALPRKSPYGSSPQARQWNSLRIHIVSRRRNMAYSRISKQSRGRHDNLTAGRKPEIFPAIPPPRTERLRRTNPPPPCSRSNDRPGEFPGPAGLRARCPKASGAFRCPGTCRASG